MRARAAVALLLLLAPAGAALAVADLALTMTASSASVFAGNTLTYTIVLANNGPTSASSAGFSDALPANTVFASSSRPSGWSCQTPSVGSGGNVVCAIASMASGTSATFKVTVTVLSSAPAGPITNSATASSSTPDSSSANNTDSVGVSVSTRADLSVTISDSPDPVVNGQEITYTMVATNNGPSDAASFTLDMPAPPNTTGTGGSCGANAVAFGINASSIHCAYNAAGRAAGATHTVTYRVKVQGTGTITGTVTVDTGTTLDPTSSNDTASTTTTSLSSADFIVSIDDSPDPVVAGNTVDYTVNMLNDGPNTAVDVVLTVPDPPGTSFLGASAVGSTSVAHTSGALRATWGVTSPGTTRVTYLRYRVAAATTGSVSLTATESSTTPDPVSANNSKTETTAVTTSADLALTMSAPSTVNAGENVTFTANLVNQGPSNAAGAKVTFTPPTGLTNPTVSAPPGWSCLAGIPPNPGIVCTDASSLPASAAIVIFRLQGTMAPNNAPSVVRTASAVASASTADPSSGNNTASASVTITTSADLSVTASDSPDPLSAGTQQQVAVQVRNLGPSTATSAEVTIPTGGFRGFVGLLKPAAWSCTTPAAGAEGDVVCTNGLFNPGTADFTLTTLSSPDQSCSCSQFVAVSSSTADPVSANNQVMVQTQINVQYDRALSISDSPDPVTAGGSITYSIQLTNLGPSTVPAGAEISDPLPAGLTVSSLLATGPSTCSQPVSGQGTVRCTFNASIPKGATRTMTVVVTTAGSLAGSIVSNTASLSLDGTDTATGNDAATATTRVNAPTVDKADVSVSGSAAPDPVTAGESLTYTLVARNNGPDAASNLTISATLPAGTAFVSTSGGACTTPSVGSGGSVSCTFTGATASGVTRTLTLVAAVGAGVADGTALSSPVTAGSDTSDPNDGNNATTVTATVRAAAPATADLRVRKTAALGSAGASRNVTYTLTVANGAGGLAAQNATLTDTLPAGTAFASIDTPPEWVCSTPAVGAAGIVSCSKPSMAAGESATFVLVVDAGAAAAGELVNTARVATTTPESSNANNSASASVTLTAGSSCSSSTSSPRLLVPIVLDVDTGSARFTTELALTNRGGSPAALSLRYTPALGDKLGGGTALDFLGAGRQLVIPDVLGYLRGKGLAIPEGGQQGGTLLVTFEGAASLSDVAATARTTALTAPPQPVGAAGLAYSGVDPCAGIRGRAALFGLRSDAADRSNVAVFNPSDEPVTFRVTVLSGAGDGTTAVVRENDALPPLGWTQYTRILDGTGIANGICVIETTSSTGSVGAYLVINDNATNDGSFLPAEAASSAGDRLTLPVLVETPAFASELVLGNRASTPATLRLSYVESLSPQLGAGGSVTVTLAHGEQRLVPDAIAFLRGQGAAIGARGASGYAGALRVGVTGASASEVFAGARTASLSPAGGGFGLFTPGVPQAGEASGEAFLFGLQSNATTRANVAVLNAGADDAGEVTLELTAFDGDGGAERGSETVTLAPGRWTQRNGFLRDHGVANGWVRVRRVSGSAPWIAYGVVNDGGSPGERTGDGAFVPMSR